MELKVDCDSSVFWPSWDRTLLSEDSLLGRMQLFKVFHFSVISCHWIFNSHFLYDTKGAVNWHVSNHANQLPVIEPVLKVAHNLVHVKCLKFVLLTVSWVLRGMQGVSSSQAKSMVQHNEQVGSEQPQYYQKHKSFNNIIWWPTSKICTCVLLFYNWNLDLNWSYISFSADHISLLHHHYGICSASDLGRIQDTSKKNSFQRIMVTHHGATCRKRCSSIGGSASQEPRAFDFVIHSKESPKLMDNL